MADFHEIRTKIRGVTHKDPYSKKPRQKIIERYVRPGTKLTAILEPDNPYGENAIGLWLTVGRKRYHVGYLRSELAAELAPIVKADIPLYVTVLSVTGGTKEHPTRGVNIVVRYPEEEAEWVLGRKSKRSNSETTSPRQEIVYHDKAGTLVTSTRLVIGEQVYPISQITSARLETMRPKYGCSIAILAFGLLIMIAAISTVADVVRGDQDVGTLVIMLLVAIGILVVGYVLLRSTGQTYALMLRLSGANNEQQALRTSDRMRVREVLQALNKAMAER